MNQASTETPSAAMMERPERGLRQFVFEQTTLSAAAGLVGAGSLLLLVFGTAGVISAHGWVPSERMAAALLSRTQGAVLLVSLIAGVTAVALGGSTYRRMPTRSAREAAASGALLGLQTAALGLLLAWFRAGNVEVFTRNFFELGLLAREWPRFVNGAQNTLVLAFGGELLGILLGLVLSVFTLSKRVVVRAPARTYINFFRGTPLIWQLSFIYFGIILGLQLPLTAYQTAVLVLGLNAGAYSAEIFRAGIQSIEKGQMEAARSLGMGYLKALWYVIMPQGFRRVIPPLTNEFVILLKDTSLVFVLGLTIEQRELYGVGRAIYNTTFNATGYVGSALGYLIVTLPMLRVVTWLERRLRSGMTSVVG